jgi:membrane protein
MTAIIYALNRAYDIEEWRPWWHTRLVAIAGLAFKHIWSVVQWPVALALVVFAVDLLYYFYFAPTPDTEWVWVTPGALLATALWLATSIAFRFYVRNFGDYSAVYGAIGGVMVLLLWFYLSGFALLVGAELNAEIDKALPSRDEQLQGPERRKKIGPAAEKAAS